MNDRCDMGYGWTTDDPAFDAHRVHFGTLAHEGQEWFYLPHQCDEWIIGNAEQVGKLIADLQTMLEDLK